MSRTSYSHKTFHRKRLRLESLEPRRVLSGVSIGPIVEAVDAIGAYEVEIRFAAEIDAATLSAEDFAISAPLPPTSWTSPPADVESACFAEGMMFAALGERGLGIFDATHPSSAIYLESIGTTHAAYDVDVAGDFAYVADYRAGLEVYDVSDPYHPDLVGTYEVWGATDVEVFDDTVALAVGSGGVLFVSVANPAAPALIGDYDTAEYIRDVEIAGDRAYVADDDGGVLVLDISDLQSPALAGHYDTSGHVRDVEIVGTTLYAADKDGGLKILDVTSDTPTLIGSYTDCDWVLDVEVEGDFAYLAARKDGLVILDVSDSAAPEFFGSFDDSQYAAEVEIGEEAILLSDEGGPTRVFQRFVGVDEITAVGAATFELTLDRPLRTGDTYQITIGPNVADPSGNLMDSDGDGTGGEPEDAFETALMLAYPPGDLNWDGIVGAGDLDLVRYNWGDTVPPGDLLSGDASGDGFVGTADLDIVRANWGYGVPSAGAVSEEPAAGTSDAAKVYGPVRQPEPSQEKSEKSAKSEGAEGSNQSNRSRQADLALLAWLTELEARKQ